MPESAPAGLPAPDAQALEHSGRLSALILDEIAAAGGSLDFSRFMELALYAPGLGYYAAGSQKLGAAGDFVTAPEISSLFSRCLARQVAQVLREIDGAGVLELGAGSGVMAADVLLELERLDSLPDRYDVLEPSPDLRVRQQKTLEATVPHLLDRVRWLNGLPEQGFDGVILANEVLDAMPVRRFRMVAGQPRPLHVAAGRERLEWALGDPDPDLDPVLERIQQDLGARLPEGYESEVGIALAPWVASVADRLSRGLVVLIDYGYVRRDFYHLQRNRGTLLCHYRHRVHADPLILPGLQDITASVDFTAIAERAHDSGLEVMGFTTQAWFLFGCGLESLMAGADPAELVAYLELTRQVKMLTLPGEMGERFKVLALGRGLDCALQGFVLQDHRARL